MSTINTNIGSGNGGFDGVSVSSGVTNDDIIGVIQDDQKTLYVNDLSDLPTPNGNDEIILTRATLGGKTIIRITGQELDLITSILVFPNGDVQLDSNGTLIVNNSVLLKTNSPGRALVTSTGPEMVIKNLILSNTGAGGATIDLVGTGTSDAESVLRIQDLLFYDSDEAGNISNFFGTTIANCALKQIRNKGLTFGNATYQPTRVSIIDTLFMFTPITNGDAFAFDTSQSPPGLHTLQMTSCTLATISPFYGINIDDISKFASAKISSCDFVGTGQATFGFNSESPGVVIAADCTGIIPTPTTPYIEYMDLTTQGSPIALAFNVDTKITNDGLNGIDKHVPSTITDLWDVAANKIILSDVPLGRLLSVVVSLKINATQKPTVINIFGQGLDGAATIFNSDSININRSGVYISVEKILYIKVSTVDLQTNGVEIKLNLADPLTSSGLVKVDRIMPILL